MEALESKAHQSRLLQQLKRNRILPEYLLAPIIVQWELTAECNFRCLYCYNDSSYRLPDELTSEEALKVAEQIIKMKVFYVILTGGEPLLRKDYLKITEFLANNDVWVATLTNGWFIDRNMARKMAESVKIVQINIDGSSPEIHDRVRACKGSWERAVKAINYLLNEGVTVWVTFVPTRLNIEDVGRVIDLAAKLGVHRFLTDKLIITGRAARNASLIKPNPSEYSKFWSILKRKQREVRCKLEVRWFEIDEVDHLRKHLGRMSTGCIIAPNGVCRLECVLPYTFGSLRNESLSQIWMTRLKDAWKHPNIIGRIKKLDTDGLSQLFNSLRDDVPCY